MITSGWPLTAPDDIGSATALAFAGEGAEVALAAPTPGLAETGCEEIRRTGAIARALVHDPREPATLDQLAASVAHEWPTIDVLVTHHVATHPGGIEQTTLAQWDEALRINLTGVFAATRAFLPLLRGGREPAIVHVGSIDGRLGNPNILGYSAAKGGVHVLVHVLAAELAAAGIRVNAIERAASTALPVPAAVSASVTAATPLARLADPLEYVAAILFLASNAASYITGVTLPVDGGRTAVTPGTAPGYRGYGAGGAG